MLQREPNYQCEYCRVYESNSFYTFQIDHIISLKHRGTNNLDNLAYACHICNRNKGSDLGSVLDSEKTLIRFFDPRTDNWLDHFDFDPNGQLYSKTPQGEVTIRILQMNHLDSILERRLLIEIGLFP